MDTEYEERLKAMLRKDIDAFDLSDDFVRAILKGGKEPELAPLLRFFRVLLDGIGPPEGVEPSIRRMISDGHVGKDYTQQLQSIVDSDVNMEALSAYVRNEKLKVLGILFAILDGVVSMGAEFEYRLSYKLHEDDAEADRLTFFPNLEDIFEWLAAHPMPRSIYED